MIVFIHIPKNGGSSINKTLSENKEKILDSRYEYNMDYGYFCHRFLKYEIDKYKDDFKITCIRNPNYRFISMYTYTKMCIEREKKNDNYNTNIFAKIENNLIDYNMLDSFDDFIKSFKKFYYEKVYSDYFNLEYINFNIDNVHGNENILYYPQNWFITNNDNEILVDKIIKLENIDEEFKTIIDLNIEKINISCNDNTKYLNILLNHDNYSDIKEIYKNDFDFYK